MRGFATKVNENDLTYYRPMTSETVSFKLNQSISKNLTNYGNARDERWGNGNASAQGDANCRPKLLDQKLFYFKSMMGLINDSLIDFSINEMIKKLWG